MGNYSVGKRRARSSQVCRIVLRASNLLLVALLCLFFARDQLPPILAESSEDGLALTDSRPLHIAQPQPVPSEDARLTGANLTIEQTRRVVMEWRARGHIAKSRRTGQPYARLQDITDPNDLTFMHGIEIPSTVKMLPDQQPIPALLHFLKADEGPLNLTEYVSISSGMNQMANGTVLLHTIYGNVPSNEYLDSLIGRGLEVHPYNRSVIDERLGLVGKHISTKYGVAHYSDFARIDIVASMGGFYFDTDILVVSPLEPLRSSPLFLTGYEAGGSPAPSSMAAPPHSEFAELMFKHMYSAYSADCWTCHLVWLAQGLAKDHPTALQVVPQAWFNPERWEGMEAHNALHSAKLYPTSVALHLYSANRKKIDDPQLMLGLQDCQSMACAVIRNMLHLN